ncbi:MAG: alpha-ketoglutarate-dependent dioxygenase AlkB [Pseudomonadota bacterium]|nr:alpha-ketoglutarate-dependent dioxygenase AlkB [Pseudomonadota bacterium]
MNLFQEEELILLTGQDGAEVTYFESFLKNSEHTYFLNAINSEVDWGERQVGSMFGKEYVLPRDTAWFGDPDTSYVYSGIMNEPIPWTKTLMELKLKVEDFTNCNFNSLLINKYETGKDKVGWHADDEKELGQNPTIASVSLGGTRDFQLRPKDKSRETITLPLIGGSLILMQPPTQKFWEHQIPPRSKIDLPRLNLTFRLTNQSQ